MHFLLGTVIDCFWKSVFFGNTSRHNSCRAKDIFSKAVEGTKKFTVLTRRKNGRRSSCFWNVNSIKPLLWSFPCFRSSYFTKYCQVNLIKFFLILVEIKASEVFEMEWNLKGRFFHTDSALCNGPLLADDLVPAWITLLKIEKKGIGPSEGLFAVFSLCLSRWKLKHPFVRAFCWTMCFCWDILGHNLLPMRAWL